MARFATRMLRAALLDRALYEEVEADTRATWQAVGVVVLSSLAAGLGSGVRESWDDVSRRAANPR
jgi:predicted trehalose synthase